MLEAKRHQLTTTSTIADRQARFGAGEGGPKRHREMPRHGAERPLRLGIL